MHHTCHIEKWMTTILERAASNPCRFWRAVLFGFCFCMEKTYSKRRHCPGQHRITERFVPEAIYSHLSLCTHCSLETVDSVYLWAPSSVAGAWYVSAGTTLHIQPTNQRAGISVSANGFFPNTYFKKRMIPIKYGPLRQQRDGKIHPQN